MTVIKVSHQDKKWTHDLIVLAQILTVQLGVTDQERNQCVRLITELTLMASMCFIDILILHTFHRIPQIRIRCLSCTDIYSRGKDEFFACETQQQTVSLNYGVIVSHLQRLVLTTTQLRRNHYGTRQMFLGILLLGKFAAHSMILRKFGTCQSSLFSII